eukprot:TRINITY_DN7241_c0_g1_i1.p2 TRINITY_DN7241_c0_g1~~TRINITY_DN7241_c0_g1_i1.p2  ORF type:complete len:205 (-),score=35.21 TRINITY_DN7241_c0_g1_i1:644-1258(-)
MLGLDQYSDEEPEVGEIVNSGESGLVVDDQSPVDTEAISTDRDLPNQQSSPIIEDYALPSEDQVTAEIVQRIQQLKEKQQEGIQLTQELKKQKDYKNPDFLRKMVQHFQIEQYGSCLSKEVFDPGSFDESNYITNLQKQWKAEEAKRQRARQQQKSKLEFTKGTTLKPPSKPPGLDTQEIIQQAKAQAEAGVKRMLRQDQQGIK